MLTDTSVPIQIKRTVEADHGTGLEIAWSSGERAQLSSTLLRTSCPCAGCLEARGSDAHAKPLKPARTSLRVLKASADEETDLQQVWPIGNYAIGIRWRDAHDSGIFTYELLRSLTEKALAG